MSLGHHDVPQTLPHTHMPPAPPQLSHMPTSPNVVHSVMPGAYATAPRRSGGSSRVLLIVGLVIAGIVTFLALLAALLAYGANTFGVSAGLSLIPLAIVLLTLRWVDRWEPEPRGTLWFALCWGAGVAVAVALLTGLFFRAPSGASLAEADFFGSVVVAPITEEIAKGLGVLLIFFVGRRHFDGIVDGVVYAGTIAAGFAFTENILYLASAAAESPSGEGSDAIVRVFVLRGLMSPFSHLFFTACIGIALGLVSRRMHSGVGVPMFLVGLVPAVGLHALWNFNAHNAQSGSDTLLAIFGFTGTCAVLYLVLLGWLRRKERDLITARLREFVGFGYLTIAEAEMVSSLRLRRKARGWASQTMGGAGKARMKEFQKICTRLAYARQRELMQRDAMAARIMVLELLSDLARLRAGFPVR